MLFNTDDLDIELRSRNTFSLLESMGRISRTYTKPHPSTIPLVESTEYGAFMVRYSDLEKLSEEYDVSIQESINSLIDINQIRPNDLIVSLEEWRSYVDPNILYEFSNKYVLIPEINTPAYRLCEACMESFLETRDYIWLDVFLEADATSAQMAFDKAQRAKKYYNQVVEKMKTVSAGSSEYRQLEQQLRSAEQTMKKQEAIAAIAQSTGLGQQSSPEEVEKRRRLAGSTFNDKYEGDINYAKRQYELAMDRAAKAEARFKKKGLTTSAQYEKQLKQAEYWDQQMKRSQQTLSNTVGDSEQGQKEKEEALAQVKKERTQQKLEERRNARIQQEREAEKTGVHQPQGIGQKIQQGLSQSKSWLAQKWAALKNWWNNAGRTGNNTGWFSNLVGKFKNALGFNNMNVSNNTTQTPAQPAEPAKPAETKAEPAQPANNTAQPAETKTEPAQPANNTAQPVQSGETKSSQPTGAVSSAIPK